MPCSITAPDGFTPYKWQREIGDIIKRDKHKACAAAPGAGKTSAAFLVGEAIGAERVVVVSPAGHVAGQWAKTATEWGCEAHTVGGKGQGGSKLKKAFADAVAIKSNKTIVIIVPWSRLQRAPDAGPLLEAAKEGGDLLVVDESHYAQGAEESTRGKTLIGWARGKKVHRGLRAFFRHTIALTGTPTKSDAKKLRAQLMLAQLDRHHTELRSKYDYERKWWGGRMSYSYAARRELWATDRMPTKGHGELVSKAVVIVSPKELAKQLPAHRRVMVDGFGDGGGVPEEVTAWADAKAIGHDAGPMPQLEDLAELRVEDTLSRAQSIAERAASWVGEAAEGRMLLVWCMYQRSAKNLSSTICDHLKDKTVRYLHGGLSHNDRRAIVTAASQGVVDVLVATIGSTGTGVDGLQKVCSHQLFAEAPWTDGDASQAEGRIVRTGQTLPVISEWLTDGIEGTILGAIGLKAEVINKTLEGAQVMEVEESEHDEEAMRLEWE